MTPDRGPDGRSLGHSHVEHVQPPNRGYAGYYLPNLYQENYRIRSAEELAGLPVGSIVVQLDNDGGADAYKLTRFGGWANGDYEDSTAVLLACAERVDDWLFLVYRPDMVPPRRDPA